MLDTLYKIGEQLLEGKGIWARLTTDPNHNSKKKNWICPILLDCIDGDIQVCKEKMELFHPEESAVAFRYIPPGIWGPRGKKCALAVEPAKISMMEETLFGKKAGEPSSMMESISDFSSAYKSKPLYMALAEINSRLSGLRFKLDPKSIKEELILNKEEEVVLYYAVIRSDQINNGEPIRMSQLDGFDDFIISKFGTPKYADTGIDYISGQISDEVIEATFSERYNMHKIFQTTTCNYASGFTDFKKNFQADPASLAALDKASRYVLRRLQIRIADVNHLIIPSFFNRDLQEFNLSETELFLDRSRDFLFGYHTLEGQLDRKLPEVAIFWINYIGFESDGNSFKVIHHIKDVNSIYLKKVIETFGRTDALFRNYIGGKYAFNLRSVYSIIPVRDVKKSKKNPALTLFKDILEQRPINFQIIFDHFISLLLCHWFKRNRAFPNIRTFTSFDFAVKDAVFEYSAFIYALQQLNLLSMEHEKPNELKKNREHSTSGFQQRIDDFFSRMDYAEPEKAMFYLGRVLSSIAYSQYKKGHESKPVLNKVNYNGMDAQSIMRLSLDLAEKVRQYGIHRETDWNFARFRERFDEKEWPLSKEQNVFYLMAGYSFGLTQSDNK